MMQFDPIKALAYCYQLARMSGDLSTKNAAIIMDGDEQRSYGINDIPRPCQDLPDRRVRPLKYQWTEHAERAAILLAAKYGVSCDGLTMVCCWAACADCARAIALSGICRLVRHSLDIHESRPDWNASIVIADEILIESGVEIISIRDLVGAKMFFDGKWIEV